MHQAIGICLVERFSNQQNQEMRGWKMKYQIWDDDGMTGCIGSGSFLISIKSMKLFRQLAVSSMNGPRLSSYKTSEKASRGLSSRNCTIPNFFRRIQRVPETPPRVNGNSRVYLNRVCCIEEHHPKEPSVLPY